MRRWVCIIALLAGFSRTEYRWSSRPRLPVPIVRTVDPDVLDPLEAARCLLASPVRWNPT